MLFSKHLIILRPAKQVQKVVSCNLLRPSYTNQRHSKLLTSNINNHFCVSNSAFNSSYENLHSSKYYKEIQQLVEQHGPESLEVVDFLEHKSFELYKQGQFNDALQFATKAKNIYQDIKMSAGEYSLLTLISEIHARQKNYGQAIETLNELVNLKLKIQGTNDSSIAGLHSKLASFHFREASYQESLQHYKKALEMIERSGSKEAHATPHLYYSAGLSAFNLSSFDESNSFTLKALDSAEKTKDYKAVYRCCHLLGLLREETNKPDDGVFYFKKALFAGEQAFTPQSYEIALINYLIGKGEFRLQKIDQALKYTNKALDLFNQANEKNPLDIADAKYNLGLMYFKQKQVDAALENFDAALEEFAKFGAEYEVKMALVLENKALILQELDRNEEALALISKIIGLCDKHQSGHNMQVARIYENVAKMYAEFYKEKMKDAKDCAQKALKIASHHKDTPFYKEIEALVAYLNKNS